MTTMLFYQDITPLSSEQHLNWKHRSASDFRFSAATNSLPILLAEMVEVARELPVVFVRAAENETFLATLVGLRENENLMLDAAGRWTARYVPAFVRRYPFVLLEADDGNHLVCVDQQAVDLLGPEVAGEPLFVDGKPSLHLQQMMNFLETFRMQANETTAWVKRMADLDLLEAASADAKLNDGGHFVLNGIFVVSETKLQALPAETLKTMAGNGDLGRIYAHLLSLGHLNTLVAHLAKLREPQA